MENIDNLENGEETFIDPNEAAGELILDKTGVIHDDEDDMNEDDVEMDGEYDDDGDHQMGDEEEEEDEDFVDESIQGFFEHTDSVYCTRSNRQRPEMAVTGGGDDLAYLWNTTTGERIFQLKGHTDSISAVGFNHDGTHVATGGMDGLIKVWDVATGQLKITLEGPSESVEWLEWHPEGNFVLGGSSDCCAFMWSYLRNTFVSSFIGHTGSITCGGFTPDGKSVVTCSEDATMRVWKPKESTIQYIFRDYGFHQQPITCLSLRHDSTLALTGGDDHFAILSNIKTGKVINKLHGHTQSISATSFSTKTNNCSTGGVDGVVKVWDIATQQERVTFKHKNTITKIISHPTEPLLYTSSVDKTICVWDERNGQQVKQFLGHQDSVLDFDLTSDGRVITASDDKVTLVFSLNPPKY